MIKEKSIAILNEEYHGYSNEDIQYLNSQLKNAKHEVKRIKKEIRLIQKNCEHAYQYFSKAVNECVCICKYCGHEIYR